MASIRKAPAPPWRTPSSAVTTSPWRAASASMVGIGRRDDPDVPHRGLDAVGRQLVRRVQARPDQLAHPEQAHRPVARAQLAGRQPDAHLGGVDVAGRRLGETDGGRPGKLEAARSIGSTSSAAEGANTVMPGMDRASAMSRIPWWLGPSSPVMPARSSTKTTGQACRPTSRLAWSKARLKKVE